MEEVKTWLTEKVPVIRKWVLDQPSISDKELVFEFWSTGGFNDEAISFLTKRKENTSKYKIDFFNLDEMIEKSKEIKSKKFTEILREYYIKEI